jgi:exodeoxyribonuclease-5
VLVTSPLVQGSLPGTSLVPYHGSLQADEVVDGEVVDEKGFDGGESKLPTLTGEQYQAVEMACALAHRGSGHGALVGAAGTGKTTTLKAVIQALDGRVLTLCPTGKAASRARKLSESPAFTIHQIMYRPHVNDWTGKVVFSEKLPSEIQEGLRGCSLVVVDEASMVTQDVWTQVKLICQEFGKPILLVGDCHQLPPVEKDRDKPPFDVFALRENASVKVTLTVIHRQAQESPIIRAATAIRQATRFSEAVAALRKLPRVPGGMASRAAHLRQDGIDVAVITHKNDTRLAYNRSIRRHCGFRDLYPEAGEPLLVRRNNYDLMRFNGEVFDDFGGWVLTEEGRPLKYEVPDAISWDRVNKAPGKTFRFTLLKGHPVAMCPDAVMGDTEDPPPVILKNLHAMTPLPFDTYLHAQLGYVLTAHNAQGSEWDHVLLGMEQSLFRMPEPERIRWVYTAVTRAKETLEVLV